MAEGGLSPTLSEKVRISREEVAQMVKRSATLRARLSSVKSPSQMSVRELNEPTGSSSPPAVRTSQASQLERFLIEENRLLQEDLDEAFSVIRQITESNRQRLEAASTSAPNSLAKALAALEREVTRNDILTKENAALRKQVNQLLQVIQQAVDMNSDDDEK